ncbi:MAG TPA: MMPL family transporter [Gaiellaceae bacterium]|jgi:RND superfamily putative drug exporter
MVAPVRPPSAAGGTGLAQLAVRAPRRVLAAVLAFAIVAGSFGLATPRLLGRGSNDFVAHGSESLRAERAVEAASGLSATPQALVLVRRPTPERVARVVAAIRSEPTFPVTAPPLRSRDGRDVLVAAYARAGTSQRVWRQAAERVDRRLAPIGDVVMGGTALATTQVNRQVQHDLTVAEEIAFPLLFLLALWVFRSLVAALLPLVCGALTIMGGLLVLRLVDLAMPVSTYALNIVTGIGLGLGLDYSLLLVSRYREELARVGPHPDAARRTLATAGRTVAFSSVTVAAAIATLAIFPIGYLRSMGIAGGLVAPLAGLIALTVLPALFVLLGARVNALSPRRWRRAAEQEARGGHGGWYRLAGALMRRPAPVAVAATAVLVVLALPFFLSVRFTGVDASVLPPQLSSRVVDTALRRDFPPTAVSPVYAVVRGTAADARAYAAGIRAPLVLPPRQLGRHVWEVTASAGQSSLTQASQQLVRQLRALPGDALVGGSTAQFLDQKHVLGSLLPLAAALLSAVTFVLLWAATRSLVLPLKALLMNVLTLSATFGILVFVFQDGRLERLLDYRSQSALELTQPVVLFAVAFGLVTDYGVFLLTRVKEAWDAGLPNREAVAVGLERTGRIITAAALLFCIAVGSFATSQIIIVKEVGIGIALAVLIDASIVRALLVPSLMAILGRWNWWPAAQPARAKVPPRGSRLRARPPTAGRASRRPQARR